MFVLLGQKNIKMKYMQKYQTLLKNFIDLIKIQCLENIIQLKHEKKMSKTHKGKKNPMHGKMWICNDETHESKLILKIDPIPEGWRKGRFCK